MDKKITLLLLAAGMGSRYGGLKQLDAFGPGGETLMEYSIFDAIRAGYGKIVFVIRRDFEDDFNERFISKIQKKVETHTVFQELSDLPREFSVPSNREKPWGTAHAVYAAREIIQEPFAVLNADDFYGRESFLLLHRFLAGLKSVEDENYCIIGYPLKETLSDFGAVSRGVCLTDEKNNLIRLAERTKISRQENRIVHEDNSGTHQLEADTIVSMNMMGFTPSFFNYLGSSFVHFLNENLTNVKAEYTLPGVVNKVTNEYKARVMVIPTSANWFGVTYKEDRAKVMEKIRKIVADDIYPEHLWEER
jgi:choline kinase